MYRVCPDQLHPSHLNLLNEKKRKEKTFKRGQCPFPPRSQYAPEMQEMQITREAPMNDEQRNRKMLARWQCRMGISIVSLMLNEKANKKGAGVEEGWWACAAVSDS